MDRLSQLVPQCTFRYDINTVGKQIFQEKFQLNEIEEVGIFRKINEKINVAVRALLLPGIRSKENDPSDLELTPDPGGQAGKAFQNIFP